MKFVINAGLLWALLAGVPAMADPSDDCRKTLDGLLETMRQAPAPASVEARARLLRELQKTEAAIATGRRDGVDECELWRRISAEVAFY